MAEEHRFKWNSWPFVVFRVTAYLIIIGILWYWRTSASAPPSTAPQRELAPPAEEPASADQTTTTVETTLYYPKITLYGWAVRPTSEGGQQVDVLLLFEENCDEVAFKELKLRVKGSDADLSTAQAPEGQEKARQGLGTLRFVLPEGQTEFRAGRIFCWVKDLCKLDSNQRVTPQRFDQWAEELRSTPEPKPGERPGTQPPAALPTRA